MLSFYIKSTIVYLIIYWALSKILKNSIENRTDINYNDYKRDQSNGMYYTFCFIPIIRIIIIGLILFISFGSKESLDKLIKKDLEDK